METKDYISQNGTLFVTYLHHDIPIEETTLESFVWRVKELMMKYHYHYDSDIERRIRAIKLVPTELIEKWQEEDNYPNFDKIKEWVMDGTLTEEDFNEFSLKQSTHSRPYWEEKDYQELVKRNKEEFQKEKE